MMDIDGILKEYDRMYDNHTLAYIYGYLEGKIGEAFSEQDWGAALSLLNEMLGLCREMSKPKEGMKYCALTLKLIDKLGLTGTVDYATTLINIANDYRAFGEYEQAEKAFEEVERIYKANLAEDSLLYAGLYNNYALLYQEQGDYSLAKEKLLQSLNVIDRYEDEKIKQAITRSNLGATILRISAGQKVDGADGEAAGENSGKGDCEWRLTYREAVRYIREALDIFEEAGKEDYHYNGALAAMGDAMYMAEKYYEALDYYDKALKELEKHVGRNDGYYRVKTNYNMALEKFYSDWSGDDGNSAGLYADMGINMKRCLHFYREYGERFLQDKYGAYAERIAVGLVGEGSDCFENDDYISMDHDYSVGFCMWLTDRDYEEIGERLQRDYEELVKKFEDESPLAYGGTKLFVDKRRGVMKISSFYQEYIGATLYGQIVKDAGYVNLDSFGQHKQLLLEIPMEQLSVVTNGRVFRDVLGIFSGIRKALLSYYPDNVRNLLIAKELYHFSQNAQSNYPRMMGRHDYVTAQICIGQAMNAAMKLVYLLNKKYAPYYKWLRRGIDRLAIMKETGALLDEIAAVPGQRQAWQGRNYNPYEINDEDKVIPLFERLAGMIAAELKKQHIVSKDIDGDDLFLDRYSKEIMAMENKCSTSELIDKIVQEEWEQFDKVVNEGGRAECQDNWTTFSIMRKSQYQAWSEELLVSYYNDIKTAKCQGWNLITEKYARMMESTAPDKFAELADKLPQRSPQRIAIQETVIAIQVGWMEEFAAKYPKMAANARSIRTSEDSAYNTSYETYLRGELGTYSEETFILYGRFVADLQKRGANLAYMIMNNTAKLYGYQSVEDAESKIG